MTTIEAINSHVLDTETGTLTRVPEPTNITIESTYYGNKVTAIGSNSFVKMGLQKVTIEEGIEVIEHSSFADNKITEVSLPSTLKRIDNYAFANNDLREVVLPMGLEYIGDGVFTDSMKLESIVIPPTVNHIHDEAFTDTNGYFETICVRNSHAHLELLQYGHNLVLMELEEFTEKYSK